LCWGPDHRRQREHAARPFVPAGGGCNSCQRK
jgi:hypothetical protein